MQNPGDLAVTPVEVKHKHVQQQGVAETKNHICYPTYGAGAGATSCIIHAPTHRGAGDDGTSVADRNSGLFTWQGNLYCGNVAQNKRRCTFPRVDDIHFTGSQGPPGGDEACLTSLADGEGCGVDAPKGQVGGCRHGGGKGWGVERGAQARHGLGIVVRHLDHTSFTCAMSFGLLCKSARGRCAVRVLAHTRKRHLGKSGPGGENVDNVGKGGLDAQHAVRDSGGCSLNRGGATGGADADQLAIKAATLLKGSKGGHIHALGRDNQQCKKEGTRFRGQHLVWV